MNRAVWTLLLIWTSRTDGFGVGPSSGLTSRRTAATCSRRSSAGLQYEQDDNVFEELIFQSPVLKQVYPDMLKWKEQYGHPNIPLGTPQGRQCQTLRRLHIQNKLSEEEVAWMESIGFTFHSLEDVYKFADFDQLFERLVDYEAKHPESNFQVPKKCPEDPELGAWVTGIRRLGRDGINPEHERRLENIGFVWKSTRQCGSKFMAKYRELAARIEEEGLDAVVADDSTVTWVRAQQEVLKRGGLSQTRVHYMGSMFGDSWTTMGK